MQRKEARTRNPGMYGGVAQLGEHLPCTQGVRSSSLLISTTGSAERRGRGPKTRADSEADWKLGSMGS